MIGRGNIKQISLGLNGGYSVLLELKETSLDELRLLEPLDLSIELKKYRAKRSLDANAYFHVLVGKIAQKTKCSLQYVKNELIGRYGQQEFVDGKVALLTTQITPDKMAEQEYLHTVLVNISERKDKTFYSYKIMRGSHTYNTKEMSTLIDGTVQEAKDLDIETLTPVELERMMQAWATKNA